MIFYFHCLVEYTRFYSIPNRECAVCLHIKTLNQYAGRYSDNCQHVRRTICNECVYKHTKFTLANIHNTDVTCPEPDCSEKLTYAGIHQILEIGQDKTLFEQYDLEMTVKFLKQMSEFIVCAHPGCNSGQLYDSGPCLSREVTCIKCQRKTCSFHGIPWHTGLTCDEYDRIRRDETPSKKWIQKNTKQCPQCFRNIEKNGGCDHMVCRSCGHEFCWKCFANYRLIYRQGLHEHRMTCSHYRPRFFGAIRSRVCTII